jgi:hypothetical protein
VCDDESGSRNYIENSPNCCHVMGRMRTGLLRSWRIADHGDMSGVRSYDASHPTPPVADIHHRVLFQIDISVVITTVMTIFGGVFAIFVFTVAIVVVVVGAVGIEMVMRVLVVRLNLLKILISAVLIVSDNFINFRIKHYLFYGIYPKTTLFCESGQSLLIGRVI